MSFDQLYKLYKLYKFSFILVDFLYKHNSKVCYAFQSSILSQDNLACFLFFESTMFIIILSFNTFLN